MSTFPCDSIATVMPRPGTFQLPNYSHGAMIILPMRLFMLSFGWIPPSYRLNHPWVR